MEIHAIDAVGADRDLAGQVAALRAASRAEQARAKIAQTTDPARQRPRRAEQVTVEYHPASQAYVHKFVNSESGQVMRQLPLPQVLDLVVDVIEQMRRKEVTGDG